MIIRIITNKDKGILLPFNIKINKLGITDPENSRTTSYHNGLSNTNYPSGEQLQNPHIKYSREGR